MKIGTWKLFLTYPSVIQMMLFIIPVCYVQISDLRDAL